MTCSQGTERLCFIHVREPIKTTQLRTTITSLPSSFLEMQFEVVQKFFTATQLSYLGIAKGRRPS